jgi:hypothetical protein
MGASLGGAARTKDAQNGSYSEKWCKMTTSVETPFSSWALSRFI